MRRLLAVVLVGFASAVVGLGSAAPAQAAAAPACDRSAGPRVQVVYAYQAGANHAASMVWRARVAAAEIDQVFDASARRQGGSLRVRWVLDKGCTVNVKTVGLPAAQTAGIGLAEAARVKLRIPASKKVLVFSDAGNFAAYCIGEGAGISGGGFTLIGSKICGFSVDKAIHELGHTFGRPHCDTASGSDPMCQGVKRVCKKPVHEYLYDSCRTDRFSYLDFKPKKGSYLARNPRQNLVNSPYLTRGRPVPQIRMRIRTASGKCVTATGAGLVQRTCAKQIWRRVIDRQGFTRLVHVKSGRCLAQRGARLGLQPCAKNKTAQQWLILADPLLGSSIRHSTGSRLTVVGASIRPGAGSAFRFTR